MGAGRNEHWSFSAACSAADLEDPVFQLEQKVEDGYAAAGVKWRKWKALYCAKCPVVQECLRDAMREEKGQTLDFRQGVRGGLDPKERIKLELMRKRCVDCDKPVGLRRDSEGRLRPRSMLCTDCSVIRSNRQRREDAEMKAAHRALRCIGCAGPLSKENGGRLCKGCWSRKDGAERAGKVA